MVISEVIIIIFAFHHFPQEHGCGAQSTYIGAPAHVLAYSKTLEFCIKTKQGIRIWQERLTSIAYNVLVLLLEHLINFV